MHYAGHAWVLSPAECKSDEMLLFFYERTMHNDAWPVCGELDFQDAFVYLRLHKKLVIGYVSFSAICIFQLFLYL